MVVHHVCISKTSSVLNSLIALFCLFFHFFSLFSRLMMFSWCGQQEHVALPHWWTEKSAMEEITTNLQGGRHASKGGVKGHRKLCRPPWSSKTRMDVRLYWRRIWCGCERARTGAAPSETGTRGCIEPKRCCCWWLSTFVCTLKLDMYDRTRPLYKPIKPLRPRVGAAMSEKRRRATLSSLRLSH